MRPRVLACASPEVEITGEAAIERARKDPHSLLGKAVALVVPLRGVLGRGSELISVDVLAYSWNTRLNRGRFIGRVFRYSEYGDWEPGQKVLFQAGDIRFIEGV